MSNISRAHLLRVRALVSLVVGVAVGAMAGPGLGVAAGVLAGWGALALVSTVWVLVVVWPMDAAQTRSHATVEDPGRRVARAIAVLGSVASLAALLVVVVQARHEQGATQLLLAGIAVVSVAASWALIQVDYMLRYARLYYTAPVGGIVFNQEENPEYTDFAYFSVGLGMTYQVADTNVTQNAFRRIVIAQTMLAYLFGAVILGTIINLLTGLS